MTTFLLIEGFDVYPDVNATSYGVQSRWLAISAEFPYAVNNLVGGRFGGQAYQAIGAVAEPSGIGFPLTAEGAGVTSLSFGVAHNLIASVQNQPTIRLKNGGPVGADVVGVAINASQQPYLYRGNTGTVLATSPNALSTGSWHYFELQLAVDPAVGTANLWIDGVEVITFTGNTGNQAIDTFCIGPCQNIENITTAWAQYDDIFVIEGTGRLGERRVETLYPASDGAVAWTPLAAEANYLEVNEQINSGDATYVYTNTVNAEDLYGVTSLDSTPLVIDGVQVRVSARKDDATTHLLHTALKSGATVSEGADWAVADTYLYNCTILPLDPNGAIAWAAASVNGAMIGQKLIS